MEDIPLIDFSKVKKKRPIKKVNLEKIAEASDLTDIIIKKAPKKTVKDENKENSNIATNTDRELTGDNEYTYDFLLERIYGFIKSNNPSMFMQTKVSIPVPIVSKVGTSRSAWTNFSEICSSLNRPSDHLHQFIIAELGVEGNLGGENQLLLKGRYNNKHIESLLKKYVYDYVQCSNCKSSNTILKRETSSRLQMLSCLSCGSEKTVQPIRTTKKQK